ncbi:hemicentin-1-like [Limulus polyphemus]|uniref:Hemicentin-1-like n=1 Tax=Limulus polyphemus TaxID=6850 RepID=A0ABM1RXC2_LIMPO|nr:hemicentin-1-like [Limulus polyphemus]
MEDTLELALWYKDDSAKPIYSLDGRTGNVRQARHSSSKSLSGRAYFSTVDRPAVLVIDPVIPEDEGSYRCRVDFHRERTRHFELYVMVIVPPTEIVIKNQKGEILENVIGPLNEGETCLLICEVTGEYIFGPNASKYYSFLLSGKPSPLVTWWKDNILLDDSYETTSSGRVRNELIIPELKRHHLMVVLMCQAVNNNISLPLSAYVTLNMNFRPLTVTIKQKGLPLSSGKMVQLECRTSGSRPPAEITWWKGSTQLRSTKNRTNKDETLTTSFLTIRSSMEDNGKYLSCKAENRLIQDSTIEDGWVLEVYHPPELTLRLGSKLRHSHIQVGNDVYLECNIRANPWVTEIGWKFEGRELQTDTTVGVIVSNQSLVLQKVQRSSRGRYMCFAKNSEGLGESNVLHLRVQCK